LHDEIQLKARIFLKHVGIVVCPNTTTENHRVPKSCIRVEPSARHVNFYGLSIC
jgi:hypothetical protein